jgi:hypothetical protein
VQDRTNAQTRLTRPVIRIEPVPQVRP